MSRLREHPEASRGDLDAAIAAYFGCLAKELDRPVDFPDYPPWQHASIAAEFAGENIEALEEQLKLNRFDRDIIETARSLLLSLYGFDGPVDEHLQLKAAQLVTKAQREQQRLLLHRLTKPGIAFEPEDELFARPASQTMTAGASILETLLLPPLPTSNRLSLQRIIDLFRQHQIDKGLGASQVEEVGRAHRWLVEEFGAETPIDQIKIDQIREFRDNLQRLDARCVARVPFRERLTDRRDRQIRSETANRHWSAVRSLFAWALSEGRAPVDPTASLRMTLRKGEKRRSPEAYSVAELKQLYSTPLYRGFRSRARLSETGDLRERNQHWWSGVIPLFTGIRAGELSQLMPSDFVFDAPIPYIKVREVDETGAKTKSTKTAASIRDVPISATLLALGLREFVARRFQLASKERVFNRLRLGGPGKVSEGMSRFWRRYLKRFGLHKPGRGTHVMRHTIIARLRALDVSQEDIAAAVGHELGTTTSKYGGAYPLKRKASVISRLEYGFDLVEFLGGPYNGAVHRE